MKRALILIGILAAGLLVALLLLVRHLRAAEHGPAGGSGVIEGVDVNATSRIAARITKVNVREGDVVKQGDVLVELDCTEAEATLSQLRAQLAAEQSTHKAAQSNATSASQNASGASENVSAAKSQIDVLKAQEQHAVESMIKNQAGALWASGTEAKSKAVAAGDSVSAARGE